MTKNIKIVLRKQIIGGCVRNNLKKLNSQTVDFINKPVIPDNDENHFDKRILRKQHELIVLRDHGHFSGNFWGAAKIVCNLKVRSSLTHFEPRVLHKMCN